MQFVSEESPLIFALHQYSKNLRQRAGVDGVTPNGQGRFLDNLPGGIRDRFKAEHFSKLIYRYALGSAKFDYGGFRSHIAGGVGHRSRMPML